MARTFKDIQDNVLEWMADQNDTGLMLTLVKQSLDKTHRKILTAEQFDFMLSPIATLSVVAGQQSYALPADFLSMLWVRQQGETELIEDVPVKSEEEAEDGLEVRDNLTPLRYRIVGVQSVKAQPTTAGVVVITPSGGNEAAANGVVVQGLDANGEWLEETLTSGGSWASLTTSGSFKTVTNVIKTGTTWTRTITVTSGSVTLLSLLASERVKQYQMLELTRTPQIAKTLEFRYYRKPTELVYDYQLPQLPEIFSDLLEYEVLKLLTGFTKATQEELMMWQKESDHLFGQLRQNYQQSRALAGRARRVRMVPRI